MMHYPDEYHVLSKGLSLPNTINLLKLNPIIDPDSFCLRVGGKLKHANLSHDEKCSYILSPKSSLAKLIVGDIHLKSFHASNQLTLSLVREFLWIPNARNLVKTTITQCVRCVRFKAKPITQMMGNLSKPRVIQLLPFSQVGIDYAAQ